MPKTPSMISSSPYTYFFSSGLLCDEEPEYFRQYEPSSPSSPRLLSPELHFSLRPGSVPPDSMTVGHYLQAEELVSARLADESTTFYYARQPRRDTQEFRSFLSLDLAESQSLRSASLRRKLSGNSKRTSANSKPISPRFHSIPEHSIFSAVSPVPSHHQHPKRPRSFSNSLNSNDVTPAVGANASFTSSEQPRFPIVSCHPPRLPTIIKTPSLEFNLADMELSSEEPISPLPGATIEKLHRTATQYTTSTVSTRTRAVNRSHALDRLEGRFLAQNGPSPRKIKQRESKTIHNNFMNMSDEDSDDESFVFHAISNPPAGSNGYEPSQGLSPSSPSSHRSPECYIAIPRPTVSPSPTYSNHFVYQHPNNHISPPSSSRKRREVQNPMTTTDFSGLNSFIDLRGDDDSANHGWRSFIELSNIS